MGKCDLSIELENPTAAFHGGDKVRGHVRIDADTEVRCRSLDVYAGWRTRGMGNVAHEHGPKVTLFSGQLLPGESHRFPFELETLSWPPTYHGFHLSIEHFIEVTADIPWAVDPKESVPIHVLPNDVPLGEIEFPRPPTTILQIFLFVFATLFLTVFAVSFLGPQPWVLIGAPALVLIAALTLVLIFHWLPRLYVGQVEFDLQPRRLAPGELLSGSFSLRPSRTIEPQFIHFHLVGTEVCVSGSGTNQKTHRHDLFDRLIVLADQPTLPGDQTSHFKILTHLPPVAAYSLKLTHNELHWVGRIHVGIPGLVDWKDEIYLTVVPPDHPSGVAALAPGLQASEYVERDYLAVPTGQEPPADDSITFAETVGHLASVRDQDDQVRILVDAVVGIPMSFTARIGRRFLRAGEEDVLLAADEALVWAEHEDPPLPLSLYIPSDQSDEFERIGGTLWAGVGEIVGWDRRGGRLQVRVHG